MKIVRHPDTQVWNILWLTGLICTGVALLPDFFFFFYYLDLSIFKAMKNNLMFDFFLFMTYVKGFDFAHSKSTPIVLIYFVGGGGGKEKECCWKLAVKSGWWTSLWRWLKKKKIIWCFKKEKKINDLIQFHNYRHYTSSVEVDLRIE